MGINVSAYARHRGVSHVAVLKAIKAGRIAKDADGTIDPVKADAAWGRNTSPAQRRKPAKENTGKIERPADAHAPIVGGPSYAQSRAIKEAYNARLAKLEYEEKSGALVRTDAVKVAWFNTLRVLRDRALNLPDRLAPLLAAETDPRRVRDLLDAQLRQILTDAADDTANLNAPIS
ncbi:MAG: hypothetical protein IPI58_05955 [Alphaproteobacteria bacterium]|nr:MAG: hypothetical protein IPI58_05955 [Alphaproteobacteria bacterium]